MGTVHFIDFGRNEPLLTKKELAARLGYSERWIEHLQAEGMPSRIDGVRRVYKETAVRNWLTAHEREGVAHG